MRFYVYDSRRSIEGAWPETPRERTSFADLTGAMTIADKVDALARAGAAATVSEHRTVIAHSAGAVPTVLAIARGLIATSSLVLVEPALYDIARGVPAIERHIGAVTSARALAAGGDFFAFWSIVRPLMFGGPADLNNWPNERIWAESFASANLPWGHRVSAATIEHVPTLVITGAWNDEYEAIAAKLVEHGAVHRQLIGHQHRPQDHPDFEPLLRDFIAAR